MTTGSQYEWDEAKRRSNIAKHRVDFAAIDAFEWDTAIIESSDKHGESRWTAIGYIGNRLHWVVFTERGNRIRIISLRRANAQEERNYATT